MTSARPGTHPVWITWERQRRSRELALALGCDFWELLAAGPYPVRVARLAAGTLLRLAVRRPVLVLVQNPSLVLATLACASRRVLGYRLVVDRHSSFKLHTLGSRAIKWRLFHALSRYTVRAADLTVVTNPPLARLVEDWGGRAVVLPDPLPRLAFARRAELPPGRHVVFPAGGGGDEPLAELIEAASLLPAGVTLHITGSDTTVPSALRAAAPANVRFTGFLSEEDYQSLLLSCNAVLALTRQPHTLLCAAYEAVSLSRPLVLSDHAELAAYFHKGRILADGTPKGIAAAVAEALRLETQLAGDSAALREELAAEWQERFAAFVARLDALSAPTAEVAA